MVDMDLILAPNESCPVREIGDGLVIMAPDGSTTHSLDEIGAFIWNHIDGMTSLDRIVTALTAEYDVDESTARADLIEFAEQLLDAGLVRHA